MVVPKGKEVFIFQGNTQLVPNVHLYLEENVVLNINSTFESLVNMEANKLATIVSGYTKEKFNIGGSNYFKEFSYQTWTKTDPLGFSFTVGLYNKTSAFTDVMKPASELMKIPLPTETSRSNTSTGVKGFGLDQPSPSLNDIVNGKNILSLKVGKIFIDKVIIKKVEPTFSQDIDDNGDFIWCILRIDAETAYSATKQMIDRFLR